MHCVDLGESFQTHTEYLLAKFRFDTAENEPSKVCPTSRVRSQVTQRKGAGPRSGDQPALGLLPGVHEDGVVDLLLLLERVDLRERLLEPTWETTAR